MATREIVVNMVPGGVTPVIHVSQYDDGYGITANLIENSGTYTVPTGATVSICLLYTSPSPRDKRQSRMPSSA